MEEKEASNFQEHVLNQYKIKAIFEAEEMHDWNSAKLYSQKALLSLDTDKIYPENISYWKLPKNKMTNIKIAHENLLLIYNDAKIIDPYNLAVAISSLDCWSEQQEENWQTWDIKKCEQDFLNSLHKIYKKISIENKNTKSITKMNFKKKSEDEAVIVTNNKDDSIIQIIYFDFDKSNLSNVSINKIKLFLKKYKNKINKFLIVGHTDSKGSKDYNLLLSIERAEVVKKILNENGVDLNNIKILAKGEENLAIMTPDNTKHPANRRVEIKKTN